MGGAESLSQSGWECKYMLLPNSIPSEKHSQALCSLFDAEKMRGF